MSAGEQRAATRLTLFGAEGVEALVGQLDNTELRIADTAAYALGRFGPAAAPGIPALTRLLGRNSGWAAHALARIDSAASIALLRDAFLGTMPEAAAALVLMGKSGQGTLVAAMRRTTTVSASRVGLFNLFVPLVHVETSELAVGVASLVRDRKLTPASRVDACSLLLYLDGTAVPLLGALGEVAFDENADVASTCAATMLRLAAFGRRARAPSAYGPPIPPPSEMRSRPLADSVVRDVAARTRRLLGENFFGASFVQLDPEVALARVRHVSGVGMAAGAPIALKSSLQWPDEPQSKKPRNTAEVAYQFDSRQHVDIGMPDLGFDSAMAALGRVGAELFADGNVEAVLFTAGITYDDVMYPVLTVYVPREASARFNWHFLDPGGLSQRLPPVNVGVATSNLKGAWTSASKPPLRLE